MNGVAKNAAPFLFLVRFGLDWRESPPLTLPDLDDAEGVAGRPGCCSARLYLGGVRYSDGCDSFAEPAFFYATTRRFKSRANARDTA